MAEFILDTSGAIHFATRYAKAHGLLTFYRWPDLDAFTQGYIEALITSANADPRLLGHIYRDLGFSDLAPETLATILRDCAGFMNPKIGASDWVVFNRDTGRDFWRDRQAGQLTRLATKSFPPLTVSLGDNGKVYLKAA